MPGRFWTKKQSFRLSSEPDTESSVAPAPLEESTGSTTMTVSAEATIPTAPTKQIATITIPEVEKPAVNGTAPNNNNNNEIVSKSTADQDVEMAALEKAKAKSRKWDFFKGLLLASSSSIFFSLTAVIVKHLDNIHAGELAVFRFIGILLFTIPIVGDLKQNPFGPRGVRHFLWLRGLAGATSLYLRYTCVQYLSIADATVIVLSQPVFVCIFARIFLKEPCGIFHVIALAVTIIGITLTSKMTFIFGGGGDDLFTTGSKNQLFGLLSGMGAAIIGGTVYVIVRHVKGVHYSIILFNFGWVAIIETSVITALLDGFYFPECGMTAWLLCGLGVLSFYGQLLLTKSLQMEEAGLVSVVRSAADVVFAFLFQIAIFQDMPDAYSIGGAVLVSIAVLLTSLRKYILNLPETSPTRKRLSLLLK